MGYPTPAGLQKMRALHQADAEEYTPDEKRQLGKAVKHFETLDTNRKGIDLVVDGAAAIQMALFTTIMFLGIPHVVLYPTSSLVTLFGLLAILSIVAVLTLHFPGFLRKPLLVVGWILILFIGPSVIGWMNTLMLLALFFWVMRSSEYRTKL